MFRFLDYVGTTSTYNEFGRVIIRTPNGDMNQALIYMALSKNIEQYMLTLNVKREDNETKGKQYFYDILTGLYKTNIFLINKNRRGHYKFKVMHENKNDKLILVLIDTHPHKDMSSIGILTPLKKTSEFIFNEAAVPDLSRHHVNAQGTAEILAPATLNVATVNPAHIFYNYASFKQLVKKFGITLDSEQGANDEINLKQVASLNKYEEDDHKQPETRPGLLTKIRRGVNIGRRGFKQYVMKKSASMSKTLVHSNQGVKDKFMTRFMNDSEIQKQQTLKRKRVKLLEDKMKEIEEAKLFAFGGRPSYSTSPIIKRIQRDLHSRKNNPAGSGLLNRIAQKLPMNDYTGWSAGKIRRDEYRRKLRENDWDAVKNRFVVDESSK